VATGIRQRHGNGCKGGRCTCPWEAFVYSKRDHKKIRKTFPTKAAGKAWRDDANTAIRNKTLRAPTVQKLVNRMVAEGKSAALIEASMVPLQAIFRHAMDTPSMGIAVNPTTRLKLPANNGRRERRAAPKECLELLGALKQDQALWATAMYAGLRRGELQALRMEDVDLPAGVIHVRRNWDQYEGEISPKSGKERTVPIPEAPYAPT
jgi:integrase